MLSVKKQEKQENKDILSCILEKTINLFQIENNKKCIYCKKIVSIKCPRCINCWLNNDTYYFSFEKIIIEEKKNFFKQIYNDLNNKKKYIVNKHSFKCDCNLICKNIIKNDKKYLICDKKKCDFFKYHPCNFLQDIELLLLKINNIDFSENIVPRFIFSNSQKIAIEKIYDSFFFF